MAGRFGGPLFSMSGGGWGSPDSFVVRGSFEGSGWMTQPHQSNPMTAISSHFTISALSCADARRRAEASLHSRTSK